MPRKIAYSSAAHSASAVHFCFVHQPHERKVAQCALTNLTREATLLTFILLSFNKYVIFIKKYYFLYGDSKNSMRIYYYIYDFENITYLFFLFSQNFLKTFMTNIYCYANTIFKQFFEIIALELLYGITV